MENKRLNICLIICIVLAAAITISPAAAFEKEPLVKQSSYSPVISGNINLSNSFIDIVVAPSGTYTMATTGGDPATTADNNMKLLFGYPSPWSSYMTIRIDGIDYYTKVGSMNIYWVSGPVVSGSSIITKWRIRDINVTQTISLTTSSTTGRQDTALFKVTLTNNGNVPHSAGARFMFDTMIGSNDAAPFRVPGVGDVTTAREFNGSSVPSFWQAFDSLRNPTVIAQGTLATQKLPDRFIMANWGSLYNSPWNYTVLAGSAIGDSATAAYWNPVSIQPGGTVEYSTAYGQGGITITQGVLTLGITSPVNVTIGENFLIMAYLQNTGSIAINNIVAVPNLPSGITLATSETSQKTVAVLEAGNSTLIFWNVTAVASGTHTYSITLTSQNTPSVTGNRSITIVSAPTATAGVIVSIANVTATPNSNVTRAIMIENVTNLAAATVWLTYDPNVVNVLSVSTGDLGGVITNIDNTTGKVTMSAFSTTTKSGNVAFANVLLKSVGQINSTSPLTLSVPSLADQNGVTIPSMIRSGTFTISSVIKGDVNGDGQVTVVDALFVAQSTVGLRQLNSNQLAAADVNCDAQVTIVDALFIAQYTVGLRTTFC